MAIGQSVGQLIIENFRIDLNNVIQTSKNNARFRTIERDVSEVG